MIKCRLCGYAGSVYLWNSQQEQWRAYGFHRHADWHQVVGNWRTKVICPGCKAVLTGFDMRWVVENNPRYSFRSYHTDAWGW